MEMQPENKLELLRKKLKWFTATIIAKEAHISRSTLINFMSGRTKMIDFTTYEKIYNVLGTIIEELIEDDARYGKND